MSRKLIITTLTFIALIVLSIAFFATEKQQESETLPFAKVPNVNVEKFRDHLSENIQNLAVNIASPVEVAVSIKNSECGFSHRLLLNTELSRYITSNEKALAFGALGVDLMYINFFNKNSAIFTPLNQIRILSNDLHISQFFDFESLRKLATSSLTPQEMDSLIMVTTCNLNQMEDQLLNGKRAELGAFMTVGAWTEGLHLLIHYAQKTNSQFFYRKVAEQQFYLKELKKLLLLFNDNPAMTTVIEMMNPLQHQLESVKFEYENFGPPVKTKNMEGEEVDYQPKTSHARINRQQVKAISKELSVFRENLLLSNN